jgi:hypothetical protein
MAVTVAVKDLERGGRGLFQDIFPRFAWTDCQNICRLATQPRSEPEISQTCVLKLYCFNRDRGRDKGQRLEVATSYLRLNAECRTVDRHKRSKRRTDDYRRVWLLWDDVSSECSRNKRTPLVHT